MLLKMAAKPVSHPHSGSADSEGKNWMIGRGNIEGRRNVKAVEWLERRREWTHSVLQFARRSTGGDVFRSGRIILGSFRLSLNYVRSYETFWTFTVNPRAHQAKLVPIPGTVFTLVAHSLRLYGLYCADKFSNLTSQNVLTNVLQQRVPVTL